MHNNDTLEIRDALVLAGLVVLVGLAGFVRSGEEITLFDTPARAVAQVSGAQSQYDVTLDGVLIEMPGWNFFRRESEGGGEGGSVRVGPVDWLSGGYFTVRAIECNQYTGRHGVWVFNENGTLIEERDTCFDSVGPGTSVTGSGANSLNLWAHAWGSGNASYGTFSIVSGNEFVTGGNVGTSRGYPPKFYRIGQNSVSLIGRAWETFGGASPQYSGTSAGSLVSSPKAETYAAVGNRLVVRKKELQATGQTRTVNGQTFNTTQLVDEIVVYSLPDFVELRVSPVLDDSLELRFLGSVGDFIIANRTRAISGSYLDRTSTVVYRLVNNELQEVQTIPLVIPTDFVALKYDPVTNRVAFHRDERSGVAERALYIYNVTDSGLVEDEVRPVESSSFAISGDYLALGMCDEGGTQVAGNNCRLEVWKGDEKLSVEPLPEQFDPRLENDPNVPESVKEQARQPTALYDIAISPNGKIMAVNYYGAYLFNIGEATGTVPPSGPGTPGGTGITPGVSPIDIQFYLDLANDYIRRLQDLLDRSPNLPSQQERLDLINNINSRLRNTESDVSEAESSFESDVEAILEDQQ